MIERLNQGLLLSCLFILAVGAPDRAVAGPFDGEWRGQPRKTCNGQVSEIVVSVHGDNAQVNVVGKDISRSAVEGAVSEYGSLFARGTVERKRGTRSFSIIRFNGHFIRGSFSGEIEIDNCKTAVTLDRTTPPDSTVGEGRFKKSTMHEPVSARTTRPRPAYPYDGEWSGEIRCNRYTSKPHDISVTIKAGSFKTQMRAIPNWARGTKEGDFFVEGSIDNAGTFDGEYYYIFNSREKMRGGIMTGRVVGGKLKADGRGYGKSVCHLLLTAKSLANPVSPPVAQTAPASEMIAVAEPERKNQPYSRVQAVARAEGEAEARRRYEAEIKRLEEETAAAVAQAEQRAQAAGTTEATIRAEYKARFKELKAQLGKRLEDAVSKTELSARKEAEAKARRKHEWEIRKLQDETAVTLANVEAEARTEGEAAARRRYEAELKKLQEENAAAVARAEQQAQTALLAATDERTVRSMQSALADLGYYDGKVDGVVGPKSRAAVSAFQSTKGYAVDGSLTTEQLAMLLVASIEKRREQGSTTEDTAESGRAYDLDFGKYHALIIGNDEYTNLRNLKTAVADATAVAKTLKDDYGFETRLLTNATRAEILGVLNELRARLGDNDNLLIYYAGHGVMDWEADVGYWLPVDAAKSDDVQWLANDRLTRILKAMQAKHVMIVADSCYSGSLVRATKARTKIAGDREAWLDRMNRKRGRTVMTSGGLEPVMDDGGQGHSVFAKAFLDALRENDGVIEGQELFAAIQRPVVVNSDQTPDYADIRRAGHDGGDFLFVRR